MFHCTFERADRVIADLLQILQTALQNVDSPHALGGLDAQVHDGLGRMRNGVAAEDDVRISTDDGLEHVAQRVTFVGEHERLGAIAGRVLAVTGQLGD